MSRICVGVLRGGPSSEYEVSLKTGANVLKQLPEKYLPVDIFISKDGEWHLNGLVYEPHKIINKVDVVFNALHGEYGEDGKVQKILEAFSVPFTGSKSLSSAIGMNKLLSKKVFKNHKIKTPFHIVLNEDDDSDILKKIFNEFPLPAIVKPVSAGSSVGVTFAKDFESLEYGVLNALKYSPTVLIEEFVRGKEATCGVVEGFRGQKIYSLLPVEILKPEDSSFFDYDAKYGGKTKEICPGNFTESEKEEIQNIARLAHEVLKLDHYSRSDMIVHPRKGVYLLEVNTLPGLTSESLFPKSLEAVGCSMPQFLDHLISLAMGKK